MHLTVLADLVSLKHWNAGLSAAWKIFQSDVAPPFSLCNLSHDYIIDSNWTRRSTRYRVVRLLFIAYLTVTDLARFLG
jgi:hypothetical protein